MQQLINVLVLACVYALFALGFNIVLGALDILNLAQGVLLTLGAFIGVVVAGAHVPLAVALVIAFAGAGLANVLIGEVIVRPLRRREGGKLLALVATLGAATVGETALEQLSGAQIVRIPSSAVSAGGLRLAGLELTYVDIIVISSTVVLLLGSWWFLQRTKSGTAIRAIQFSEDAARALGIPVNAVVRRAFLLSGGFAGVAGVLVALLYLSVDFQTGDPYLLLGFVVVVIGGFGSAGGTVVASFVVAAIEIGAVIAGLSGLSDGIALGAMFVILLIRPSGLFARTDAQRA
ncbi:MAG: branched-chain amino acid ABC transporter permease [Candidatus Dormibacteria bacterium]